MATTSILCHETLSLRDHPFPLRSRRNRNPNPKSNNRREPESMVNKPTGKNLFMGQVKILKRGEPLIDATTDKPGRSLNRSRDEEEVDLILGSTNRLGPYPETRQKQIQIKEFNNRSGRYYAGSSSLVSPPPSSVPVPGFLGKTSRVCT